MLRASLACARLRFGVRAGLSPSATVSFHESLSSFRIERFGGVGTISSRRLGPQLVQWCRSDAMRRFPSALSVRRFVPQFRPASRARQSRSLWHALYLSRPRPGPAVPEDRSALWCHLSRHSSRSRISVGLRRPPGVLHASNKCMRRCIDSGKALLLAIKPRTRPRKLYVL